MGKEYNITRTTGRCAACDRPMEAGEEFMATIRRAPANADEEFVRVDFCQACWQGRDGQADAEAGDVFGTWLGRMPEPKAPKRKTFVDDEVLGDFFRRLAGVDEPAKRQFRFVLALILMRKKLLIYDRSQPAPDGGDLWTMHWKGSDESCDVIDPHMDEEMVAEVSRQLGSILEGEL